MTHNRSVLQIVETQSEGQLLQSTVQTNLVANDTVILRTTVPIGRGDVVAYAVTFTGKSANDIRDHTFNVAINGKDSQQDLAAIRFANLPDVNGTSERIKVYILIPEGSRIVVTVNTGAIPDNAGLVFDMYFTEAFMPVNFPINYSERFRLPIPPGSGPISDIFTIPKKRGHIVGIALTPINDLGNFTDPTIRVSVEINGVSLIEDAALVRYLPYQDTLLINNWVVNIKGGGILKLSTGGSGALDLLNHDVVLYFSEDVAKSHINKRKKSPILDR